MNIVIRNIDINTDIQGIRETHGEDEHWGSDGACFSSAKTSLENNFFIQAALHGDKIVGHTEWVISDEPEHKFLYLGIMQIHGDYQKKGIGTELLESGAEYAKANNCAFLRTMPEIKTGSDVFYKKRGFVPADSNSTLKIAATPTLLNMTSRERVRRTINREKTDFIPNGLGGCETEGLHVLSYYKLRETLGLPPAPPKICTFMTNAVFELDVIQKMKGDVVLLASPRMCKAFYRGFNVDASWKEQTLWGKKFSVPLSDRFSFRDDGSII